MPGQETEDLTEPPLLRSRSKAVRPNNKWPEERTVALTHVVPGPSPLVVLLAVRASSSG